MSEDLKDLYREGVSHALGGFQLLEEGLKTYLDLYYGTVRALLGGKLHFAYQRSDIQDAPLGRLLTVFSKVCSNQELLTEMRALVKDRDLAAHQAFICLYGPSPTDQELLTMIAANSKLAQHLSELLTRVHGEQLKVLAVLQQATPKAGHAA